MRIAWPLLLLCGCTQGSTIVPNRIVSNNPCIDAVLAEVADPASVGAISSYSKDAESRSAPVAWAKKYPAIGSDAEELIAALNYFYEKTKNDITLEYILFKDLNDSIEDAAHLVKIYRQIPTHLVNVIEYNPIAGATFTKPDEEATKKFTDYLVQHRVNVRVRRSRGKDIDAACGQLANK